MFGLKKYLIRTNRHYSGFRFRPFFKRDYISAYVCFTDSCRYYGDDLQLKEQINKLFGFGAIRHHKRSYRIGWRYNANKDIIELFEYKYEYGIRFYELVDTMKIGQTKKLTVFSPRYIYFGKYLFPYFGGKYPAPKNILIKLQFC